MSKKKSSVGKTKFKMNKNSLKPRLIKKRRKEDHCLNCNTQYDKENNYCPNCGQENNHNRASFGTLIMDFFHNYFSFDSKFSNSLLPFFLQPGYLTKKFVQGKRASFVNPVRLYLIISLLFFFVFSMVSKDLVQQSVEASEGVMDDIPEDQKELLDEVMEGDFSKIDTDSIYKFIPADSSLNSKNLSYTVQKPDSTNEFFTEENIALFLQLRNDRNFDAEDIMDTLNTSTLSSFEYNLVKQAIRLESAEKQIVISQLLKNLPIMMFLLIPLFALVLKLFYVRRNQFYITHLIHALHLHSFAYIIYGFAFVMAMYWFAGSGFLIIVLSLFLVTIHSYMSFLKVYGQKVFKTFFKFSIIGFVYSLMLLMALFVELFFSVITY